MSFKNLLLRDPQLYMDYLSSDYLDLEILLGALASRGDPGLQGRHVKPAASTVHATERCPQS